MRFLNLAEILEGAKHRRCFRPSLNNRGKNFAVLRRLFKPSHRIRRLIPYYRSNLPGICTMVFRLSSMKILWNFQVFICAAWMLTSSIKSSRRYNRDKHLKVCVLPTVLLSEACFKHLMLIRYSFSDHTCSQGSKSGCTRQKFANIRQTRWSEVSTAKTISQSRTTTTPPPHASPKKREQRTTDM
jgi:hypothetical protein